MNPKALDLLRESSVENGGHYMMNCSRISEQQQQQQEEEEERDREREHLLSL